MEVIQYDLWGSKKIIQLAHIFHTHTLCRCLIKTGMNKTILSSFRSSVLFSNKKIKRIPHFPFCLFHHDSEPPDRLKN